MKHDMQSEQIAALKTENKHLRDMAVEQVFGDGVGVIPE